MFSRTTFSPSLWQTDFTPLPALWREWLAEHGSLTQKLQAHCPQLAVQVVREGWVNEGGENRPEFSPAPSEAFWLREVQIFANADFHSTPLICAQTVLPARTVHAKAQAVFTLGNQPIGLWLFAQNPVRATLEWQFEASSGCYARRSTLLLAEYPLEIYEQFSPTFLDQLGK